MVDNFSEIKSNWQFVLAPARPSIQELNRINALIYHIDRKSPVAVLGSTIEFRNLLHQMGFSNIYIFEKNKDFYKWSNTWITHGIEYEYVVWGDWLYTIKNYTNFFSVILSDETMGFISYENRKTFYQSIFDAIMPEGFFIDKELTHCIPHIPIDSLMRKYLMFPINLETINRFACEVLFCSTLLNSGIVDTSKFYSELRERFKSPILRKYIELAHIIIPEDCIWFYGKMWEEVKVDYYKPYTAILVYDDVPESPYYGRVKQFINFK